MPAKIKSMIIPFRTEEAAIKGMNVKNPNVFEKIEHRKNKDTGNWEVILIPKQ